MLEKWYKLIIAGFFLSTVTVYAKAPDISQVRDYIVNHSNDSLKIAIKKGFNVNDTLDDNNNTCLYYACYAKNYDACKILLANGADPNTYNIYEECPLLAALEQRDTSICMLLLKKDFIIEKGETKIATEACNDTLLEIFKLLCDKKMINPHSSLRGNGTFPHYAAWKKQVKILRYLYDQMVDIDYDDEDLGTPLQCATYDTNLIVVDSLLKYGCNPCYKVPRGKSAVELMNLVNVKELTAVFEKYGKSKCK